MRILFYNCVYRPGHMYFDTKMIEYLSDISEQLVVLQPDNWFQVHKSNIVYSNCELPQNNTAKFKRFSTWTISTNNSLKAIRKIKQFDPDVVVIGEYELSTFGITIPLLRAACSKIVVVNHNNIDQLAKYGLKRLMFNWYKNKIYHCTLEPFIKEYAQKCLGVREDRVFCWPHPAEPMKSQMSKKDYKKEKANTSLKVDIIGLSQSNDERFIQSLIRQEIENSVFKNNNLHVVLKSKEVSFDDGFLTVIKGWIDIDTYDDYYNNTCGVLVAFPSTFQYRVSATLIEAIRDNIQVLGSDIELMRYYNKEYPNICKIYCEESFVNDLLCLQKANSLKQKDEFESFMTRHSDTYICNIMLQDLRHLVY